KTVLQMTSVGSTHKKQKAKVDIISKLPDSLISHILSCLPTEDAVRTSVLSKRWIDCWTLINKVNLDEYHGYYSPKRNQQHFINFVYKTLLLIKKVESFTLFIRNKYDATLVNAWISCILNRRPKNIHIGTDFELSFSAHTSHSLFNDTYNLEELVLKMCDCDIKVPPSRVGYFIFGNLKVIKLCGIIFTIDQSLVIRLSVLKNFETENCCWLSAHDVTIEAPLLENVFIEQDCESITREPRSCKIKFTASCIKEFTYRGCCGISQPIVLSNSSAARNASVTIILDNDGSYVQETEHEVYQIHLQLVILLKQFSEVKCIKFHASEVKIISLDLLNYVIL
ncbi:F-box/FBD/LRR-repeat protein, partial [Trifolium medium]|nr:F-box/FBD/LRR-repeat protein [Trifolium medium]